MEALNKYWSWYLDAIWDEPDLSGPTSTITKQALLAHRIFGFGLIFSSLRALKHFFSASRVAHQPIGLWDSVGWALALAAAAFVLVPGVFRLGSKSALKQKGERVFAIENESWKPLIRRLIAILLFPFAIVTGYTFMLGCYAWLLIFDQRRGYFLYDTEHHTLEEVVLWGVLKFSRSSQKIIASALSMRYNNQSAVFILEDGGLFAVPSHFFRSQQSLMANLLETTSPQSLKEMLAGWHQTTGLPALAEPISDTQAFKDRFQSGGLGAFELMSDWKLPALLAGSSILPTDSAPP